MKKSFVYVFVREFRVAKVISIPKREIELTLLGSEGEGGYEYDLNTEKQEETILLI
jgi:hypothetical protein